METLIKTGNTAGRDGLSRIRQTGCSYAKLQKATGVFNPGQSANFSIWGARSRTGGVAQCVRLMGASIMRFFRGRFKDE